VRRAVVAALSLSAAVLACRRDSRRPVVDPEKAIRQLPGGSLLPTPAFRPPADGILTADQVDRFLRVRRAAKGRTDAESARALGISPEEISWTRARIVEAMVALDERRVRESSGEVYARTLATLRAARTGVTNPERAKVLEEQIATLERERSSLRSTETPGPALAANMHQVAARRAEIEPLAP
jgi:hypothetical protein